MYTDINMRATMQKTSPRKYRRSVQPIRLVAPILPAAPLLLAILAIVLVGHVTAQPLQQPYAPQVTQHPSQQSYLPHLPSPPQASTPMQPQPTAPVQQPTQQPQPTQPTQPTQPARQFVLLDSNIVRQGLVTRGPGKVSIDGEYGKITLPSSDVRFVGRTLGEVYQYKRSLVRPENVESIIKLAQWSAKNDLLQEAAIDLNNAKRMSPDHPQIALTEMIIQHQWEKRNSDQSTSESIASSPVNATDPNTSRNSSPGPDGSASASASDLPDAASDPDAPTQDELLMTTRTMPSGAVRIFTQSIQPLLLSSCGATNCHGGNPDNDFQLEHATVGNHSIWTTQRNLHETMRWIDHLQPHRSPLLTETIRPGHGGFENGVFVPKDLPQLKKIAGWVTQVCSHRPAQNRLAVIGYMGSEGRERLASAAKNEPASSFRDSPYFNEKSLNVPDSMNIYANEPGQQSGEQPDEQPRYQLSESGNVVDHSFLRTPAAHMLDDLKKEREKLTQNNLDLPATANNEGGPAAHANPTPRVQQATYEWQHRDSGSTPGFGSPDAWRSTEPSVTDSSVQHGSGIEQLPLTVIGRDPSDAYRGQYDIKGFKPADPFDPEIFNRRYFKRPIKPQPEQ